MRFSTTALLALPVLAAAAESPFEQYKAKFQNFISNFGAATPSAERENAPAAAAPGGASTGRAKSKKVVEPKSIETLTLENWKDTLYSPVQTDATGPEEWLVLLTGGNKTCFGHCAKIETAFSESALNFAALPPSQPSPHLAKLNCDDQPVLCNSWSANTGALWLFSLPPPPAPADIATKRVNLTTVTTQDIVDAYTASNRTEAGWQTFAPDGYFHPLEGKLAKLGLSVPLGYALWALNAIPSWGMMLIVSFLSRTMMNRRMDGMAGGRPAGAQGAAAAPRAAPAGDGRS
ncbi:uncharacterized protein C8A04DRAFT_25661 [Dichotomopilus funicola]|uniref:Uncharacterized protein n=1 Tax=Dichotomopilus funicola TaxID=1934379 RepID=A0AAN6ZQM3_9PEZI|nr:hypothetical protein C8A04DRAFT_25661 [Dichotomopilus funicola]